MFREKLEERGLLFIECASDGIHVLHRGSSTHAQDGLHQTRTRTRQRLEGFGDGVEDRAHSMQRSVVVVDEVAARRREAEHAEANLFDMSRFPI